MIDIEEDISGSNMQKQLYTIKTQKKDVDT